MIKQETFRPQFHFTPQANWLNDPNGLVFYQGEFHLFYQYHPDSMEWGPMHWGHAVSPDLINWTRLQVALYPDELGTIFSGSVVIDWQNTAGLGAEAMIAIFTHHNAKAAQEYQSLAYSLDKGRSWTKYAGNPVIPMPDDLHFFRDPKVFWHENTRQWLLVLSAGDAILFYASLNLIDWTLNGRFDTGYQVTDGVWETPDLFALTIDGGPDKRWVLSVGAGNGTPAGRIGMKYFVGQFDGHCFTSDHPPDTVLWVDGGADFYAAQSWSGVENGRRIWLGWLNNWRYANVAPTSPWRGAMSLPREVSLTQTVEGVRLVQQPLPELTRLRHRHKTWPAATITPTKSLIPNIQGDLLEIIVEFQIENNTMAKQLGMRIQTNDKEATTIGYIPQDHFLFIDRAHSGLVDFSPDFPGRYGVIMPPIEGKIRLHVFIDRSSIELFGNDGLISISKCIFPEQRPFKLELYAEGGQIVLNSMDIYLLKPADFRYEKNDE